MKKTVILLLAAVAMLLAACSPNTPPAQSDPSDSVPTGKEPDLQAVYDECAKKMPEMIVLDATMQLNYCGIKAEDCVNSIVAICADSLRTDEIWLIEAVDEEALDRLASLVDARLKSKGEESITYSPEQYAIVQKAKVIRHGSYLALLVSPDVDALEAIFNQAAGI